MTDFRAAVAATNRGFPRGIGSGTVLLVIWDPDSRVVKELVLEQ